MSRANLRRVAPPAGTADGNYVIEVTGGIITGVTSVSSSGAYTDEQVRDVIGAALVAGSNITVTVNDAGNTITIAAPAPYTDEQVRDVIGAALVAGTGVSISVNDAGDTITITSTVTQYTDEMARDALGTALVAGTNVTITVNDAGDTITIASTGGGTTLHCKANTIIATAAVIADLAATPYEDSLQIFLNGDLLDPGSGNDYQISGTQVTFTSGVLVAGDKVRFCYWTTTSSPGDTSWHAGSVVAGGVPSGWAAGNTNPVMPSAATVGQQAILSIATYSRLGGVSQPTASGWILIGSNTTGTPDGGAVRLTTFKKIVASGEPGNAVTVGFPADAGAGSYACVTTYGNVSSVGSSSYQYTNSTSTPNNPLVTTIANTLILHVVMTYRSNGGATLNISEPGGVTHRFGGNNGDTHGATDFCDEVQAIPGTASTRTFTNDGGIGAVMDVPLIPV